MATPADVYGALTDYVRTNLGVDCYLGREPEQTTIFNRKLPYVCLDGRLGVEWLYERNFVAAGTLTFHCYAEGSTAAVTLGGSVEALFGDPPAWPAISAGTLSTIEVAQNDCEISPEEAKSRTGQVVYRYEVPCSVKANGVYVSLP